MRNTKAKAIRKKVYGSDFYPGPNGRKYEIGGGVIKATGSRRVYQDAKKNPDFLKK